MDIFLLSCPLWRSQESLVVAAAVFAFSDVYECFFFALWLNMPLQRSGLMWDCGFRRGS